MMRGIRRLVVCTAATGLLAAGAITAGQQVALAQNFAAACGGNADNGFICNMDTTVPAASAMTVTVDSGSALENVNVNWTVECTGGNQLGATDNAATPLTVPLTPLPSAAADGTCNVNVGISLPAKPIFAEIAYTGQLTYTPAGSTSSSSGSSGAVHPVKGFGGKCADDKGNSSANGAAVVIWSCSGSDQAENWKYSNDELVHNGMCLNDKGNGGSGSKVVLYKCNGGSNEKWTELANGELKLKSHNGALCADDPRSSTKNGTQLIVYTCKDTANQKWSLP
jgi:hypothetical protein